MAPYSIGCQEIREYKVQNTCNIILPLFSYLTDNWGLVYAQQLALKHSVPLMVGFCLVPKFLDATWRQYSFMLSGLQEVEKVKIKLYTSQMSLTSYQVPTFGMLCSKLKNVQDVIFGLELWLLFRLGYWLRFLNLGILVF